MKSSHSCLLIVFINYTNKKNFPFKKISQEEYQLRREKDLCYKYGEKCAKKQLNMVVVEELQEFDGEEYIMYVKKNVERI